jgi:hypothetical protein
MGVILNKGKIDVLDKIVLYGENRPIKWTVNPQNESKFWKDFDTNLTSYMQENPVVIHAHTYSISVETYNSIPKLQSFMKITQTDTYRKDHEDAPYIASMEANDYPIYTTMYHPEYQLLEFEGKLKWDLIANNITDEIAFRLSRRLFLDAL